MANIVLGVPPLTKVKEVAYVSTFPPRKCGIATFTSDLINYMGRLERLEGQRIISIDGRQLLQSISSGLPSRICRESLEDYLVMADFLNQSSVDVVNIQHEFGIFGGEYGEYICSFMNKLKKPITTTLHTVLPNFEGKIKDVFSTIVGRSSAIIVLNNTTRELVQGYGVDSEKIRLIPHGCPDIPLVPSSSVKPNVGLQGRFVISSFGLLSKGKGIEYVIEALPEIVKEEPRVVYLVLGVTHPQVKQHDGEEYRKMLLRKTKDLGLDGHVRFLNRFLSKPELINYLQSTDVYITPYLSPNQVSSGTLSYALGAGKAIVSTPYLHAKEALGEGRGLFCNFNDSSSIAEKVNAIIENPSLRRSIENRAYAYSRKFTWPLVAEQYFLLFDELARQSGEGLQSSFLL